MRVVKTRNIGLSTSYIATLAVMDGFGVSRRTAATVAAVLTVLALTPTSLALAQSAGDRQYADPLVTDGGDQSGQQSPSAQGGDDRSPSEPTPTPSPAPDDSSAVATSDAAAPAETTLPHTGAEPRVLAAAGLVLAACGALGLALPRRARDARR
jgi:LPXTG-motif cell wall-anchored protein